MRTLRSSDTAVVVTTSNESKTCSEPVTTFQICPFLSLEKLTTRHGSDITAKAVTGLLLPLSNVAISACVSPSQMRILPFPYPVTMRVGPEITPSAVTGGLSATLSTPSSAPDSISQMRAVPSSDALTIRFPPGIAATALTGPL